MTTFSQLVDKMVLETKRPDMATEVATYLNQTIRELHFEPTRGNAAFFRDNLLEDQLTSAVDTGFYWDVPKVSVFQGLLAVRYDSVYDRRGEDVYAKERIPGRGMIGQDYFYYRAGTRIYFSGYGGINALISLAWYEYPSNLAYYVSGSRPAIYDEQTGWTYATAYDVNDSTRLAARQLVSNWVLLRWPMVLEEGLRAKVYKRLTDTERARTSYSMYTSLRQGFYTSELAAISGSE